MPDDVTPTTEAGWRPSTINGRALMDKMDHSYMTVTLTSRAALELILAIEAEAARAEFERLRGGRPEIVCLIGSTRFADEFTRQNLRLTLEGRIVLSIGANVSDAALGITQDSDTKTRLDELHLRKIDLADRVFCLNVGGYVGESTRREILYALAQGKRPEYLDTTVDPWSGKRRHNDDDPECVCEGCRSVVENMMRGFGLPAINARKTHCVHGHPFDEANTYRSGGKRCCRACNRRNAQRSAAKSHPSEAPEREPK
jgi:hypothetical protein